MPRGEWDDLEVWYQYYDNFILNYNNIDMEMSFTGFKLFYDTVIGNKFICYKLELINKKNNKAECPYCKLLHELDYKHPLFNNREKTCPKLL